MKCIECGVVGFKRYGHTAWCSLRDKMGPVTASKSRAKMPDTVKVDTPSTIKEYWYRVAVVMSTANPGQKTFWLARGEQDIARVESNANFVYWADEAKKLFERNFKE